MLERAAMVLLIVFGLLAAVLLTACDKPGEPAAELGPVTYVDPSPPKTTPPPPSAPPTCAPGTKAGAVGDEEIRITSGGIEREAIVHVPPSHDGERALPVVLVIHPLLLTFKDMKKLVKVEPYADDSDHGFIAVFPNGIDRSWNAGECCGKAKDKQIDDVGFIHDLLAEVAAKWCVDPDRLYSMGFSNGAFLSHRLACELEGGVRAIVPVAGTLGIPEPSCVPKQPTAVLAIHGTDDELVPYEGGPPKIPLGARWGTFISPTATDEFWSSANGCGPPSTEPYYDKGEAKCVRHGDCKDGKSVSLCTVAGGGHQWPGATSLPAMGHVTSDLDATAAAIELFRANGL